MREGSAAKRLVVVTDNPLIVTPINAGVREIEAFELLGYLTWAKACVATIRDSGTEVVLIDEGDSPERAVALIGSLREQADHIAAVFLTARMGCEHLERALEAGALGAVSKAIEPAALATLLREALRGNIAHSPASISTLGETPRKSPTVEPCSLTKRELEILRLVVSGATNSEIAQSLWITQQTVKFHLANVYRKLDVSNRTEACHYAHVNGLIDDRAALPAAS